MTSINQQTPGPAVANDDYILIGVEECPRWPSGEFANLSGANRTNNARLFAAGYTAFDRAGRALGIDAAELAERIDITELVETLRKLKLAAFSRQVTMGDPCDLLTAKAELDDAIRHAGAVLDKLRGLVDDRPSRPKEDGDGLGE